MPTREQALAAFGATGDYRVVGARLGVPPGQAYLVATGLPADGGDTFSPDELDERPGTLSTSTQALVYHRLPAENPTTKPHVHEWVRRLAGGDEQMCRAAADWDAAPGEVREPEETDVCTVLTRQHDQVTAMLKQLKTIPGVSDGADEVHQLRRKSVVDRVTVALSRHEATEQEHFWPAVRSTFDDGRRITEQALEQEQKGKDLLDTLGRTPASEEEFDQLVEELEKAARKHVAFEDVVLLALQRDLSVEDRRRLGQAFLDAERQSKARSEVPGPHHEEPSE